MQINREDYIIERDYRKKRLEEFQEAIQENLRGLSTEIIAELVDERERQNLTQKDVADITGNFLIISQDLRQERAFRHSLCLKSMLRHWISI